MSLFDSVNNLISYKLFQATNDPDAKRFAEQQKAARKKQEAAAKAAADAQTKKAEHDKVQAVNLKKAEYSSGTFAKQVVKYTVSSISIFIYVMFALYTGHLAANDAIGRSPAYRILYFIYGALFCIFVLPYYIIQHLRDNSVKSYAILPIREGMVPAGIEGFFLSFVTYMPDEESIAATNAFQTALKAVSV